MAIQSGKAKRKSAPVSSHPLFPAIVALWFAALFGLGSLAIRPTLLESFVLGTHIDTIIPAAAPPLGVTARILLALVLAVAGGLAGAAIAQRVTRPKLEVRERKRGAMALSDVKLRARDTHPDAPARRPISAHDEIGGMQIESAGPSAGAFPGRRRSLAIRDEGTSSDFHDFAPLPGGVPQFHDPQVLDLAEVDLAEVDLGEFEQIAEPDAEYSMPVAIPGLLAEARQLFGQPASFDPAPIVAPPPVPHSDFAMPTAIAAEQIAAAPLGSLGLVELTERFALSLQRRRETAELAATVAVEPEVAEPVAVMPAAADPAPPSFARMGAPEFAAPIQFEPADPMAMPASLRPMNFDDFTDDEAEDFTSFLPLRRMSMPAAPAADEPIEAEHEQSTAEELDDEAAFEPELASEADIDEDDGYSSLLGLSRPNSPRQQFVRIDEPAAELTEIEPVVIFPGQAARGTGPAAPFDAPAPDQPSEVTALRRFDAPASAMAGQPVATSAPVAPAQDAEETERALRAALATLQRMSGAA
ncbi:MAG TPA: hypothetical protein VHG29_04815 [Novosphingobium sp.]|nr:hypothetical protein [Novosphingobium sp.]